MMSVLAIQKVSAERPIRNFKSHVEVKQPDRRAIFGNQAPLYFQLRASTVKLRAGLGRMGQYTSIGWIYR